MSGSKQLVPILPKPNEGQSDNPIPPNSTPLTLTPAEKKATQARQAQQSLRDKRKRELEANRAALASKAEKLKEAKSRFNEKIREMLKIATNWQLCEVRLSAARSLGYRNHSSY
jgi:hypothetical protein